MTTTEPRTRRFGPDASPTKRSAKVANHPVLWVIHAGFAHIVLPALIGPAFVAGIAGVPFVDGGGTVTGMLLLVVGVILGGAIGAGIGPRKVLFPARPSSATRRGRRGAR